MINRTLIFIFLSITSIVTADSKPVAIINGNVYTMSGPVLENATVILRDGKIQDVGASLTVPPDAQVIDAKGKRVLPGFIDANCRVGLVEIDQVESTVDSSETVDPITSQMRVTDAFFPDSASIGVTRSNGITSGIVSPDHINVITGMSAWISFSGMQIDQVILKPFAGMNATLGEPPKEAYGEKEKMPSTRMGIAALLRENFQKAKEYEEKWKRFQKKESLDSKKKENATPPEKDFRMEALVDVLNGKIPLIASAQRADDILTAIRIADEFGIKQNLVINHGAEAYKIAGILAREKIPVIVGPVTTQPERMETLGVIYENAALLQKAGVLIALQTNDAHNARNLPYEAGIAVANGLPYEEALKAITINPARIFHIDQEVGTIQKGKRADILIANGDPLEPKTEITNVFIGGQEMPNTNYQKRLWETFLKKETTQ
jgi:imidazolonepropionase-like amidohydrolase